MKLLEHVVWIVLLSAGLVNAGTTADFNIVWTSPSLDHDGSMPLGNGDIGLNAWIEPSGDLVFYISKTDTWGDNGRLLKVGKVRVTCDPPLVINGSTFRQELDLETGTLRVQSGTPDRKSDVSLWVDANHPVVHITLECSRPVTATAAIELWRTDRYELPGIECSDVMTDRSKPKNMHAPTIVEPDTVLTGLEDRIGWYHHNTKSVGPDFHAKTQGMTGYKRADPLLHRTFGAIITVEKGKRIDDTHLRSTGSKAHRFSIHVLTKHPASPEEWRQAMERRIAATGMTPFDQRKREHGEWWRAFWDRSWIHITQSESEPSRIIPENDLPIKVGIDQQGHNRFAGEIRHAAILDRALTAVEVAERHGAGVPGKKTLDVSNRHALDGSVTIETWVRPTDLPGGGARLVDNITPGGSDGLLMDTHPGDSLRLIVGRTVLTRENCLTPNRWHHVVATVDVSEGRISLYRNGELVAESGVEVGDDAFVLSRAYALQRFVDACAGRGRYPIKFNGSIFTVPSAGKPGDGDYRRWGPGYWWQNTRLPYLSMCTSGDFEMLEPLFRLYVDDFLPINRYRTKHYFGFDDAACYIECVHFFGDCFNETYGWQPMAERKDPLQVSGWHKWEWVAGPELVWMMLDAYDHTLDEALLEQRIIPMAAAVMRFFDQYYKTDDEGVLVMHPSMACETWWTCTNPMPELAGLRAITARLLALPEEFAPDEERAFWHEFMAKLPPLPTRDVEGGQAFAPAGKYENKRNIENPELYCVFPFRLSSFEKENRELALRALEHRWDRGNFGWRQEEIFMAYLGLAEDARRNVVGRARNHHKESRFPAFWGPNYDWIPDQDHGGVLMKAVQAMLLQTEGDRIYLLPAWPGDWNAEFKLHAPRRTVIEGRVAGGKVVDLKVTPAERRGDVIVAGS
jgi:hypothetical protein